MTKILNSLLVTGTGTSSQAIGVTAGYVAINNSLSVGTWNLPSTTDFYILSSTSSNNPMRIRNSNNTQDILKVYGTGEVEINNGQTSILLNTLTLGSTSSTNGAGVLQVGSITGGLKIIGDVNYTSLVSSNGKVGVGNSYSSTFNYFPIWIDVGTSSSQVPMISTNTNVTRAFRLASGGGTLYFSTNVPNSTTYSTVDRLIIPGTTFSNPLFTNIGTLQIENVGVTTRNIATSSSFPNTFIIGSSQSSINISGTTYGIPTSWNQGSIIIAPGNTINMTASHFPVSGLTHTNNSNIIMVAQLTTIPTGNYNVMIGGTTRITTGFQNVGIGNFLSSSKTALGSLTTGSYNVAIGSQALGNLTTGSSNVAIGDRALRDTSAALIGNIGIGNQSGMGVSSSYNIFIGHNAGRLYNGSGDTVLYLSSHNFTAADTTEASVQHYSTTYTSWVGLPPTWAYGSNFGNVVIIGNESAGSRDASTVNNTGTYKALFFGKGMWHQSQSLNTYIISTSLPTANSWTSSGVTYSSHNDAFGSSLELVAGPGRGSGTAGDIYFSTGQFATAGTNILQNKVNRMTIKGGNGFIGIGNGTFSNNPTTLLHIYSTQSNAFRLQDGTQGLGKVLVSDANGNASWGTASSGGSGTLTGGGTTNYIPVFSGASSLTNSSIYQGSTNKTIVIGYTQSLSNYDSDTNSIRVKGDVYFDNATTTTKKFYLNGTYLFNDVTGNLALGYQALGGNDISSSSYNIGIGYRALYGLTQGGNNNVTVGYQSMFSLSTGDKNIGLGYFSLNKLETGSSNISIGDQTLSNATSSNFQIAIGDGVLQNNTIGTFNIAIGNYAMTIGSYSSYNIAIGAESLYNQGTTNEITGSYSRFSIGIGYRALYTATSSYINTSIGHQSLYYTTTGRLNLSLSYQGLYNNTTGNNNVSLSGYRGLFSNVNGNNNVAIGAEAIYSATSSSSNIGIGHEALRFTTVGELLAIGQESLWSNVNGLYNLAIGHRSSYLNEGGSYNLSIGHSSLRLGTQSSYNTAIGYNSLYSNNGGSHSTAIGVESLRNNVSGGYNVGLGNYTLYTGTSSLDSSVAVGYAALYSSRASNNVAIGRQSQYSTTDGVDNVSVGGYSLTNGGNRNVAIGQRSLFNMTASNSNNNIAIGDRSATGFLQGSFNIFITSTSSNIGLTNGSYNTVVGQNIIFNESTSNNTILGARINVPTGVTNSIIVGDGTGNRRFLIDSQGRAAIGLTSFSGITYSKMTIQGDNSTAAAPGNYDYSNSTLMLRNSNGDVFFTARNNRTVYINGGTSYQYLVNSSATLHLGAPTSGTSSYAFYIDDSSSNYLFRLRSDGYTQFGRSIIPVRVGINKDIDTLSYELDVVGTASFAGGNVLISNKVTQYNGETTAGNGLTTIVATSSFTNLTSSLPSTPKYTISRSGMFRHSVYMIGITGSGGVVANVTYNDGNGTYSQSILGIDTTTTTLLSNGLQSCNGTFFQGTWTFFGDSGIVYIDTTLTGTGTYSIYSTLERLT